MPLTIAGHVINNDRRPVKNVAILYQGKRITETRNDGFFAAELATSETRVALTFIADGYVVNTKVYGSRVASTGNTIVIWPIAYRIRFDPSRELDIDLGGSRIRAP